MDKTKAIFSIGDYEFIAYNSKEISKGWRSIVADSDDEESEEGL